MMPVNFTCPDEPVLHKFALGQMPPEEVDSCAEHISACEHCIQSLSRFKVNDTLVDALASQSTVKDQPEKSAMPALLDRLKKFGQAAAKSAAEAGENTTTVDADSIPAEDATQTVDADAYDFLAPAQESDEIGRLGSYRVLGVLGKGGMGVVFEAEDTHLKRRVALKVMKSALAANETSRKRFQLEAQHMASVRDDHIVTIYQVGEDRQIPFLAMECLEGQSLDDLLKRNGKLSTAHVLRIGIQTACGLAAAHEKGLIHRDIKPGNIWLEPVKGGRVKILDFGLARAADSEVHITQTGAIVGTPAYMSPEQAQGQEINLRSDLFSLGSVLYHMATGQLPFESRSNTTGMLLALAMDTPPQPREINPDIPQELNDLIVRLLAKDPAQRPDSAQRVIDELKKIEKVYQPESETTKTEALTVVQPSRLSRRKRLRPVAFIAAALLVLIGGGLLIPQIVIRLRDKDGNVISETKVPKGVQVEIVKDGKVVKIPRDKKPPAVADDADPDRRAAEWVLSLGGKVFVEGLNLWTDNTKDLPRTFTLTKVILNHTKADDAGLVHLKDLTNLASLHLENTQISDAGLVHLKGLTNLSGLNLRNTQVSDAGLVHLKNLKNLTGLDLGRTQVSDAGLVHLKDLKNLSWLQLAGTHVQVSDAGLVHLKELANLSWLDLNGTQVSDAGLAHLKDLKNLAVLQLFGTRVSDAGLVHLEDLKNLSSLELQHTEVSDAGLVHLKDLKNLSGLYLRSTQVSDAGLVHLKDLKNLAWLDLRKTRVSDAGLVHLKDLKNLSRLNLDDTQVSDPGVLDFVRSRTILIQSLTLSRTRVSAEVVELVRKTFPEADISWSEPNHSAAVAVLKLGGAVHVGAKDNGKVRKVQDPGDLPTKYFQVRRVDLSGIKAPLQDVLGLLAQLTDPEFDRLETLDLSGSAATGEDLQFLKSLVSLQTLSLQKTKLTQPDDLVAQLTGLTDLRTLSLQDTPVTDLGLPHIAKLTGLKQLNLEGTQIKGIRLDELNKLEGLTTISLACKGINDLTVKHVAKLKQVQNLSLAGSAITDAGLKELHTMTQLRELDLSRTKVTAAGIAALQKALPECKIVWDGER